MHRFLLIAAFLFATIAAFADPPQAFTLSASGICAGDHPAVLLQWTSSDFASTYDITRDGVMLAQGLSSDAASYQDESNDVGTQHSYFVTAINEEGSIKSNTVNASAPASLCTTTPPAAPSLTGNASCSAGPPRRAVVTLNWTPSSGATSYAIVRNNEVIQTTSATSASDFTVATGTSYTYLVRAINSGGSADSNSITVGVAFDICGLPPGTFSISTSAGCEGNGAKVTVAWSPSSGATSYVVFRNAVAISQALPGSATSYIDSTVAGDVPYSYVVRAANDSGTIDSNTSNITVPEGLCGNVVPTPPQVTASLTCILNTPAVHLVWTVSQGATSYIVVRDGIPVTQLDGNGATTFDDTNVTVGKTYAYLVRAANPGAASSSSAVTIAVKASVCSPLAVTGVGLSTGIARPGDVVTVTFNVTNRGGAQSPAATVTIRIGTLAVGTMPVSPIGAGLSVPLSQQITIPSLGSGVYFVTLFLSDDDPNPASSPALTITGIPSRRRSVSH